MPKVENMDLVITLKSGSQIQLKFSDIATICLSPALGQAVEDQNKNILLESTLNVNRDTD